MAATSDLAALVRGVLADPSTAGVLADYLEERGDARGVLLRRRWKRWESDRTIAAGKDEQRRRIGLPTSCRTYRSYRLIHFDTHVDREAYTFRQYLRRTFSEGRP